jgi:hypothetical protein
MDRAIETGHVPLDPDARTALSGLVDRRLRQARLSTWLVPVVMGAFTLLGVSLLVTRPTVAAGVETCVFAFFLVWGLVVTRRQRRKLQSVKDLLDRDHEGAITSAR